MKPFTVAHRALCCKADIPEIQAVIRLLDPFVQRRLREVAENVLRELMARLTGFTDELATPDIDLLVQAGADRDEVLAAILAALVAVLEQGYGAFVTGEFREHVEDGIEELLAFAAIHAGFSLSSAGADLLREAATSQLDLLLRETVLGHSAEIRSLMEDYLTNAGTRSAAGSTLAEAAGDSVQGVGAFGAQMAASLAPRAAATTALDAWAYLWTGAGVIAAGQEGGIRAFEVVAVRDTGTTKFCRWVDGRLVPLSRVRAQLDAITRASLGGEMAALRSAWPFLDSDTARNGNQLEFQRFFNRAGIPPYHFGCRTLPRPVRLERP